MEYEHKLISLYGESPLPKMFIELCKKSSGVTLCIKSTKEIFGQLFVWANKRVIKKEVQSNKLLILPSWVGFEDDFVFVFFTNKERLVGSSNSKKDYSVIINHISKLYQAQKEEQSQEIFYDKEEVVSNIIKKVFGFRCLSFFEQTKNQLGNLFSCLDRAVSIEKIIPYSKFVYSGEEGDRSYIGIVYKNNLPFVIGVGFDMEESNHLVNDVSYQLFYNDKSQQLLAKNQQIVCFTFRSCFDGENIWLK